MQHSSGNRWQETWLPQDGSWPGACSLRPAAGLDCANRLSAGTMPGHCQ